MLILSVSSIKVNNKKQNIIILWLQSLLLLAILIFAWNLKSGQENAFGLLVTGIALNFLLLILYILVLNKKIELPRVKKSKDTIEPENKLKTTDEHQVHREYVDPKSVAERIFKNSMLKRSLKSFCEKILQNLAREFELMQGVFYLFEKTDEKYHPKSFYAILDHDNVKAFTFGEGIAGQAVNEEKITVLSNLPDDYRQIVSGLGNLNPKYLYFVPLFIDKKCIALIEFSTFKGITETRLNILNIIITLGAKKMMQFREKINE